MQRRTLIQHSLASALLLGTALAAMPAAAQGNWPTGKPITYLVPFPPGGNTDTLARVIAQPLSKALGTPVVIENKGGAGGSVGSAIAARAPADGYTILGGTISSHAINVSLYAKLDYDPVKSFTPVAMLGSGPLVLVVPASSPYRTLADVLAASKAKAAAGGLTSASPGSGTSNHMALELLGYQTGVKFTHIPYKGSGPAVQDVIGGQVDMMFDTALVVGPHVQAGKLKGFAVTGKTRHPGLPAVPTTAEAGMKGFELEAWVGIFAPAGTPADVVNRLSGHIKTALELPETKIRADGAGIELRYLPPAALDTLVKNETAFWEKTIKAAGIKPE